MALMRRETDNELGLMEYEQLVAAVQTTLPTLVHLRSRYIAQRLVNILETSFNVICWTVFLVPENNMRPLV